MVEAFPTNLRWASDHLEAALSRCENLFGPRSAKWTIGPILHAEDGPYIFFPYSNIDTVNVVVSTAALPFDDQLRYQIGHEALHLLSPNKHPPTCMIEEGAAVYVSIYENNYRDIAYPYFAQNDLKTRALNYQEALQLYREVEASSDLLLKSLRVLEPQFSLWTPEFITGNFSVPGQLAIRMCERRQMR